MKRVLSTIAVLILAVVSLVSCGGGYGSSSNKTTASGFGFRAFVSNALQPAGGAAFPVLSIVDAAKDRYTGLFVNLTGSSTFPGLMAVTPNLKYSLVFSSTGNTITVVANAGEAIAQSGGGSIPVIPLLGATESITIGLDSGTAFVAVPNAIVAGHPQGAVEVLSFLSGSTGPQAVIPVASAHFLVQSHNGNRILVFSDNPQNANDSPPECPTAQCITLLTPSLLSSEPRSSISSPDFDHPVWGAFSGDDSKAYILNCGPQCGGTAASISVVDFTQTPPAVTTTVPVPAATYGLLVGANLYVAGTPSSTSPDGACPSGTEASTCGQLSVIDTGSLTVTTSAPITDGYHDRMAMGANGQLFVGAKTCTNINDPGSPGEVRGCLSIFNTSTSAVVIPPDLGDVTGIEPITQRNMVYVCQNGHLRIYDTTTDALIPRQAVIVGQVIDVKLVDPPGNFN